MIVFPKKRRFPIPYESLAFLLTAEDIDMLGKSGKHTMRILNGDYCRGTSSTQRKMAEVSPKNIDLEKGESISGNAAT